MARIFELPEELLATLSTDFPGREPQTKALTTLLCPRAAPCRNLIVHGTEATGKTAITERLLESLGSRADAELNYAIVKSAECVTARHLFERTVGLVADAVGWERVVGRCETLAALVVELSKVLKYVERDSRWRFVLVFDGIDRQREAPPTMLPALARLSEIIPQLTTVFIVTTSTPSMLRAPTCPHLHFPPYTKAQYLAILALEPPPPLPNTTAEETSALWTRFVAAVHDSLTRPASRTLPGLQRAAALLWPRFSAPVAAGTHKAREFTKLLVAARAYFQEESILEPGIVSARTARNPSTNNATGPNKNKPKTDLATLLPPTARLLLISAYLASHNPPRHDQTLFSTWHNGKKRRRGGGGGRHQYSSLTSGTPRRGKVSKHRKIARKLLGPSAFVLERMVAIYIATRREWVDGDDGDEQEETGNRRRRGPNATQITVDGDVGMAIATLASLRLLVRVGGGVGSGVGAAGTAGGGGADMDRGGKWRVNVGWEVVRAVGRSMGVEVEEWLIE